jgi:hypothetical protein
MRTQASWLPFDFNSSGGFGQQYVMDSIEFEGWWGAAVTNNGVRLAAHKMSLENQNTTIGSGVVNLTSSYGYTAAVTAGSGTLTFSSSMTGILYPNLSIIQVSDNAGNSDYCMVTAVSGASVTVQTLQFRFTWSCATAKVSRIHAYGIAHLGGSFNTDLVDCSGGPALNTPAYVYVASQGMFVATNCEAIPGNYQDIRSIVIGNLVFNTYGYSQMTFTACSPMLCADASNPFVYIDNFTDTAGSRLGNFPGYDRMPSGSQYQTDRLTNRKWLFSPRLNASAVNRYNLATIKQIAGDASTQQEYWAWYLDSTSSYGLGLHDETFPGATQGRLHIHFRAKAATGSPTLSIIFLGDSGKTAATVKLTTTLQRYDVYVAEPSPWSGTSKRSPTVLGFSTASTPWYFVDGELTDELGIYTAQGGTFTLTAGAATVSETRTDANSVIRMSLATAGGTISAAPYLTAFTPGTSFVVQAGTRDTSTYNYTIEEKH